MLLFQSLACEYCKIWCLETSQPSKTIINQNNLLINTTTLRLVNAALLNYLHKSQNCFLLYCLCLSLVMLVWKTTVACDYACVQADLSVHGNT